MEKYREQLKDKKRIVVKIGSSSLMHDKTGRLDLLKMERLVRVLVDIKNSGKDVILVLPRPLIGTVISTSPHCSINPPG